MPSYIYSYTKIFTSPREGKFCVGSDTKFSLLGRGNFVWGTQNFSSINHGGEILCVLKFCVV